MEDKKDIGKAFKDKLDGLQKSPGDAVWQSLSADLDKRRKRRLTSFWFRVLGIAFIVLIIASAITYYTWEDTPATPSIKNTETENTASPSYTGKDTNTKTRSFKTEKNKIVNNDNSNPNTINDNAANKGNYNNTDNRNGITGTDANINNSPSNKKTENTTAHKADSRLTTNTKNLHTTNYHSATNNSAAMAGRRTLKKSSIKPDNITSANKVDPNENTNSTSVQKSANKGQVQSNNKSADNSTDDRNSTTTPLENNASQSDNTSITTADKISSSRADSTTKITGANDNQLPVNDSIIKPADSLKTIVEEEQKPDEKKKTDSIHLPDFKRWYVAINGGPAKYIFPSNKSIIDPRLDSNSASVKSSFNLGAYIGYRFSAKWGVRLGINSTKIEHVTKKAYLLDDMQNPANFKYVKYATDTEPDPDPGNPGNPGNPPLSIQGNEAIIRKLGIYADIQTKITYIEIPAEVTFHAFGNRSGADITGGLSALFINKNTVTASNEMGSVYMGTLDCKKISFSTNVGLKFYYQFIPALQLNIEPAFRYYLNTFNNVKPYSLNLQAGLQYNFDIGKKK